MTEALKIRTACLALDKADQGLIEGKNQLGDAENELNHIQQELMRYTTSVVTSTEALQLAKQNAEKAFQEYHAFYTKPYARGETTRTATVMRHQVDDFYKIRDDIKATLDTDVKNLSSLRSNFVISEKKVNDARQRLETLRNERIVVYGHVVILFEPGLTEEVVKRNCKASANLPRPREMTRVKAQRRLERPVEYDEEAFKKAKDDWDRRMAWSMKNPRLTQSGKEYANLGKYPSIEDFDVTYK